MDAVFFSTVNGDFQNLISSSLPFLEGSETASNKFRKQCKSIYDFCKVSQGSKKPDPLPKLIIDGFDDEQIWGELELFNRKEASICLKAADVLISLNAKITFREPEDDVLSVEENDEEEDSNDGEFEEDDEIDVDKESGSEEGFRFEESEDDDDNENSSDRGDVEKTEVDDDFFSLRKMEKFLDDEDRKYGMELNEPNEEDIDYFGEIPPSDDEELLEDEAETSSEQRSSRHLKYADYFDAPLKCVINPVKQVEGHTEPIELEDEVTDETKSAFDRHQHQISKKIAILEDRALAPADWQMKGEVKAGSRPENSLLQETLLFDNVARPAIDITEEHTQNLEDLIKQRIVDCAWDDVEKKYKPQGDIGEYKKRLVLDSSKSKLTLSEIYEKEYVEKTQKLGKKEQEEKDSEDHIAIKKDMDALFRKLDALSNFHFIAPPPEPEIKLIPNVPSIAKEEVQPVTQAESHTLAPEEVFTKSVGGEEKSTQEKTSTDKKRERRKKKLRMKANAEEKLKKLKKLNPESEKVKSLEAIDQLKRAAKAPGSNTTILKKSKTSSGKLTSQRFFSKLQQKGGAVRDKKRKT